MAFSILRTCLTCGARNRVPARHLADAGRCGSCRAALPPLAEPLAVDAAAFDEITREARVPVLVDFWAEWCGPCRMVAPEVDAVAREASGRALVLKVETDAQPELAARFDVRAIPTLAVLQRGRTVHRSAGVARRAEMRRWLDQASRAA